MLNQLRADTYRQLHTWGTYIVLAITILFSILITSSESVGGLMVSTDDTTMDRLNHGAWSVLTGLKSATLSSTVLLYIDIAIFVIIIGQEFSKQVYKNTLITGITRLGFIVGKFIMMLGNILILTLIFYGTAAITGKLAGRSLGTSGLKLGQTIGNMTLTVAFFISVIFSLGVIMLVLTNSVVAATVGIVLWSILIGILASLSNWTWLKYLNFTGVAQSVALGGLKVSELGPYLGISGGLLLLTMAGSAILIQYKEL